MVVLNNHSKTSPLVSIWGKLVAFSHLIRLSHTVFSLPFALTAVVLAAVTSAPISVGQLFWILFALVSLRSAALTYNRIMDRDIDALNPRTKNRELVTGKISLKEAWIFLLITVFMYLTASVMLKIPWLFIFSFLAVTLGYSHTKRFTWLTHYWVGVALAGAPLGAWLALKGTITLPILFLAVAVVFWVGGFDILYSLQDMQFDQAHNLYSIPRFFGVKFALIISRSSHILSIIFLALVGLSFHMNIIYYVGLVLFALGIVFEQSLVKENDFSRINLAFFTTNGILSIVFFLFSFLDYLIFSFLL